MISFQALSKLQVRHGISIITFWKLMPVLHCHSLPIMFILCTVLVNGFLDERQLLVSKYSFDILDVTQINYLIKARREKMLLIEGDSETFKSILALMDDYEGLL